jgi:hypothetical protein
MEFQLRTVWSTNLRSGLQAKVVHRGLALNSRQAKVDLLLTAASYGWQAILRS